MTSSERSELEARAAALRRIVYGTPGGHLSAAAAELETVEAQLRSGSDPTPGPGSDPISGSGPIASPTADPLRAGGLAVIEQVEQIGQHPQVDPAVPDPAVPDQALRDPAPPGAPPGTRRRVLVMVAVAAAIAVVAALGPLRALSEPPRGLEVFDRAPDPSQALMPGNDDILTPASLASVRYIGTEVGYRAWVFRDRGDVCLTLQRENWNGSGTTCVAESDFARSGIRQVVRYEQLRDLARPVGVGPGDGVEFAWTADSTGLEWSMRR
ncbi:hypothetical protein [Agromyces sp. Leaf222]|uniref:hypothetical protein n=1 Tax=Agromyces sp. Leaf222 TaxID=1735688 RepID=UPI000B0AD096|nr:hypothetical protein [Agromyces sp. Leaf222]